MMNIYYEAQNPQVKFGVDELKEVLGKHRCHFFERTLGSFYGFAEGKSIIVFISGYFNNTQSEPLQAEGFRIKIAGNAIYIEGADNNGAMYGLFEIAEQINLSGIDSINEITLNPFHEMRGTKFNLPYESYGGYGDPYEKNLQTCMDIQFWREYIDFLARNRYNCLSLWSEHPFHMMFRIAKYPDTCPYNDVALKRFMDVYKFIFSHCKKRGIKTYLITWNICLIPQVAKGLGLNEEIGYMTPEHYQENYKQDFENPDNKRIMFDVRQKSPLVKDYLRECIKTLAMTYMDLDGIGTNCAEEMNGDAYSRHEWISETYFQGIEESGRKNFDFFIRTNMGSGKIAKDLFVDKYKNGNSFISWKYSNAHMYSSTCPKFEEQWGAWEDISLEEVKVVYTIRNDDYYTFRSGSKEFLKEYIINMKKPYVHGFYWGADGYIWARNFQHIDHKHLPEEYDFQKHWFQFEMIGRFAYCPTVKDDVWIRKFEDRYGKDVGREIYEATCESGKILPPINRLHWENYDFQWHPESLITQTGFRNIVDVMNAISMQGENTICMKEYARLLSKGAKSDKENANDVINVLEQIANNIEKSINTIYEQVPIYQRSELFTCTLLDLEAWRELSFYYKFKFEAALNLCLLDETEDENYRTKAITLLEQGLIHWENLAYIWASHYVPYKMVRTHYTFGYTYYIDDVKKDIEMAKNYDKNQPYHLNLFTKPIFSLRCL